MYTCAVAGEYFAARTKDTTYPSSILDEHLEIHTIFTLITIKSLVKAYEIAYIRTPTESLY